ncbi:MAG: DUF2079 domain-containing protein [Leptolyngbyaceae cyanobacterium bins.302]|nr:DUF2079 domain-containing protein [Leptolyngbyaceae cyanobacterium bins.302]
MKLENPINLEKSFSQWQEDIQEHRTEIKRLLILTVVFLGFMLLFSLHRHFTYYTSYDQGLFNQIFWNNLHGRFFQSSLTSANSVSVLADNEIPRVDFVHLGQHFVPTFLLWLPIYALFPNPATLVVLQVGLMTAGGVVLYALARHYLSPNLSLLITAGYFGANAVIGPTFANFYEHCQFPLFMFGMLLAMEKRRWGIFWVMTLLVLGIREDAGIALFGIGLFLLISRRHPRIGAALCVLSFVYVVVVTNVVITGFSEDNPRLYMAARWARFAPGNESPSTLQVLWGMLTHPIELLQALFLPFDRRFFYLIGQWLPLAFIPAISPASWVMSGVPLLTVFSQSGQTALGIAIRYAVAIVPGLFYGTILWWAHQSKRALPPKPASPSWFTMMGWSIRHRQLTPAFRQFWAVCLVISIISTIAGNPNQAFYFLIPDSFQPWVFVPITKQWERSGIMNDMVRQVPPDATVAATTNIIPHLSTRQKIIRFPSLLLKDETGQVEQMEYVIADLWRIQQYMQIHRPEMRRMELIVPALDKIIQDQSYGVLELKDKIIFLRKGVPSSPEALGAWESVKQELLADLARVQAQKK